MTATDGIDVCSGYPGPRRDRADDAPGAAEVIARQAATIRALQAQAMRLRADVVIRETALAWAREELDEVHAALPGLARRRALAHQVRLLEARIRSLVGRDNAQPPRAGPGPAGNADAAASSSARGNVVLWLSRDCPPPDIAEQTLVQSGVRIVSADRADAARLASRLADADLVICQAGCVSHGDWWRVRDYCRRTGKPCVLVEQPNALRRVIASTTPLPAGAAGAAEPAKSASQPD